MHYPYSFWLTPRARPNGRFSRRRSQTCCIPYPKALITCYLVNSYPRCCCRTIFDETVTENPFGGDAFHLFQRCTREAQGRMSRSAVLEFSGRELKDMIYDQPADRPA